MKSRDLLLYFKSYINIFNGAALPEPKTILEVEKFIFTLLIIVIQGINIYKLSIQATAEANNLSAMAEAKEVYETLMEEVAGGAKPYLQPSRLEQEHHRARDKALHGFRSKKKMGGDEIAESYADRLVKVTEESITIIYNGSQLVRCQVNNTRYFSCRS